MKKIGLLLSVLIISGCALEQGSSANVSVINSDGDEIGTVEMQESPEGVKMSFDLTGLPPGEHAVHIHNKNKCDIPDFLSAGEHLNPDDKQHGLLNPEGAHAGDLPNLIADEQGVVKVDIVAPGVTLKDGKTTLFTKDGTSIVIHENADDGMSQPAGNGGERIACGEIKKK
ncbi:superoxide dismutase family protein [Mangrovibacillus cuniculi]|uniref:Superoxide dismutase [Cu-Zn] n=1 Tax=Mangrovibacillus cuniculi TaxID=2593652 RepID=A0A7S8CCE2_9BACI|nr:superoxide dismutase family protein [Mangrovibacillus cuniculi]QPC47337.1 superoxide dismutase family protein [Mangrovibacillus cuniculi]